MPNQLIPYNKALKQLARKLRNESTLSEVLLWKQIKCKALGCEFHRQVPIGNYIVDFYCHELRLAIEIDGVTHENEQALAKDALRQQTLEACGVHFIRFSDSDIKRNVEGVVRALQLFIRELH